MKINLTAPKRAIHLWTVIALVSSLLSFVPIQAIAADRGVDYTSSNRNGDIDCVTDVAQAGRGFFRIVDNVLAYSKDCAGAVNIPDGVTAIDSEAFDLGYDGHSRYNQLGGALTTRVTSLTIPNSVTSIGSWAFRGSSISTLTIPNSVTSIGEFAFVGASELTDLTLGTGVTTLSNYVFSGASSLTALIISNTVTIIGDRAFENTSSLTERDRLRALPVSKETSALRSIALKTYMTAQKKSASDYKDSKPAAAATKDAANKAALDAKTAAIARANNAYGTFIESIGYGV